MPAFHARTAPPAGPPLRPSFSPTTRRSRAPAPERRSPSILRTAHRTGPGRVSRHGSVSPAPAHATRAAVLRHVADRRAAQHRDARRQRPATVPCPPWQMTRSASRHHLRVGEPIDHPARSPAPRAAARPHRRFVVASTRTGSSASASSATRTSRPSGSCAVLGATSTSGPSPSGSSTSGYGSSKLIGPVTWTCRRPAPRVLELRERRHQRQLLADPAVEPLDRRQPDRPRVRLRSSPPRAQPGPQHRQRRAPQRPSRPASAAAAPRSREERHPRLAHRIHVRHQCRPRHPGRLGRQRGRQRQDVADHDVRPQLLEQRHQRHGGLRRRR